MKNLSKLKNFIMYVTQTQVFEVVITVLGLSAGFYLMYFGVNKAIESTQEQIITSITQTAISIAKDAAQIKIEAIPTADKEEPVFCDHAAFFEEEVIEMPTDEDVELLAHLIMGEAGSDYLPDEMRIYVGSVALNRVSHEQFPNTLEEVIYQRGQYACTWDGNFDREPTDRCYEIATDLLINGSVLPEDVVFQAQFIQGSDVYKKIGNTYFCRL